MSEKSVFKWDFPLTHPPIRRTSAGSHGVLCRKTYYDKKFFPLHNHSFIEFEYLLKGNVKQEINGVPFEMTVGGFHCLDHHDTHSFVTDEPYEFNNLCIDIRKMSPEIIKLLQAKPLPYIGRLESERMEQMNEWFGKITELQASEQPLAKETLNAYLSLVIIEFLKMGETVQSNFQKTGYGYIKNAAEYIENNYQNRITLNSTAGSLNISPNYLSQIFPKYLGCSFIEYLNGYRVNAAKEMILSTDLNITDIALSCGFGSLCSFSRAFNKYAGCSAQEFRRNFKNTQTD